MSKNILVQASKLLVLDYILEILYFPVWWYGAGLKNAFSFFTRGVVEADRFTGFSLLLRNIFKPMFAQYDKQGRIISFVMRLVLIIYKGLTLIFLFIFYLVTLVFWLGLPVLVVWGLSYNLPTLWQK